MKVAEEVMEMLLEDVFVMDNDDDENVLTKQVEDLDDVYESLMVENAELNVDWNCHSNVLTVDLVLNYLIL
jgi:hypothetical protein